MKDLAIITCCNEVLHTGHWIMLAPYGQLPGGTRKQEFNQEDAQMVVHNFYQDLENESKKQGVPIYIGHPDVEELQEIYQDNAAKGRVKKLEARPEGLFAQVKWSS